MLKAIFKILTNNVFGNVLNTVKELILEYKQKEVDEADIEARLKSSILQAYSEVAQTQSSVLVAEAKGEDWLQRNWRGLMALAFTGVFLWFAVFVPVAVDWFGLPPLRVGDLLLSWMFHLMQIALGGGIGGGILIEVAKVLKS